MKSRIESLWAEARIWMELALGLFAIVFGGFLIWLVASWFAAIHILLRK